MLRREQLPAVSSGDNVMNTDYKRAQADAMRQAVPASEHTSFGCAIETMVREAAPARESPVADIGNCKLSDLGVTSLRFVGLAVALEELLELSGDILQLLDSNMTVDSLIALCRSGLDSPFRGSNAISFEPV